MDAQGDLAGADGLFAAAQEEGDVRGAGADIQHHETAAGILGSAETEIGAQGRAFRRESDEGIFFRYAEAAFPVHLFRTRTEQPDQSFTPLLGHFIRDGETPGQGRGAVIPGLQGCHEHDLVQAEGNGTAFLFLPFQAGIQGAGRNGKGIPEIRRHQDYTVLEGQRIGAGNIPEDPGCSGQQRRDGNSGKEFLPEQVPGNSRIIQQGTDQGGTLERQAAVADGEHDGRADRTEINAGGIRVRGQDFRCGKQVRKRSDGDIFPPEGERQGEGFCPADRTGFFFRGRNGAAVPGVDGDIGALALI